MREDERQPMNWALDWNPKNEKTRPNLEQTHPTKLSPPAFTITIYHP
jgi:hypothetical protein